MKNFFLIVLIFVIYSCTSKEERIISIINRTNINQSIDFFHMQIPSFYLEEYSAYNEKDEFYMARHIYNEGFEKQRMFYIINLTEETVILVDDDYKTFFEPIASRMLGKAMTDLSGDVYMKSLY